MRRPLVGVSPSAILPVLTPSGAEVALGTTDNWATPTELNVTWLAHAKELGYMLSAAASISIKY